jgi:hypothetical protein
VALQIFAKQDDCPAIAIQRTGHIYHTVKNTPAKIRNIKN